MNHSDNVSAMAEIMRRLDEVSRAEYKSVLTEAATPETLVASQTQRTGDDILVSNYTITPISEQHAGISKSFYQITHSEEPQILYSGIALVETALALVKHEMYTHQQSKIDRIIELDSAYSSVLIEAHGYKQKMETLDEDSPSYDVVVAKYTQCKERLGATKLKLLAAL